MHSMLEDDDFGQIVEERTDDPTANVDVEAEKKKGTIRRRPRTRAPSTSGVDAHSTSGAGAPTMAGTYEMNDLSEDHASDAEWSIEMAKEISLAEITAKADSSDSDHSPAKKKPRKSSPAKNLKKKGKDPDPTGVNTGIIL